MPKGVNTRENGSSRRAVYVYYDARAHSAINRSVGEFSLLFILLPGVSQTCSQLIHTRFVAAPRQAA